MSLADYRIMKAEMSTRSFGRSQVFPVPQSLEIMKFESFQGF